MNRLRRARAYLASLPPAISGSGGHNTTFLAACWLARFGLTDQEALPLLRDYNRRCRPPWTEKELAHKLRDARRAVAAKMPIPPRPAPPVEVEADVLHWLASLPGFTQAQSSHSPQPTTQPRERPNFEGANNWSC